MTMTIEKNRNGSELSITLIGRFFQSRAEVGTRNNMMMFVTARLITTQGVPKEQNVEKGIPDFLR